MCVGCSTSADENARIFNNTKYHVHAGDLLLRIHDETSISPLSVKHGFKAPSASFGHNHGNGDGAEWISTREYRLNKVYQHAKNRLNKEEHESCMEITRHVLGGWKGYINRYQYSQHDLGDSPWISTSGNLNWAIWEIVRRIVKLNRDKVGMSIIKRPKNETYPKSYKGTKSLVVNATTHLRSISDKLEDELDAIERDEIRTAIGFSEWSDEYLYFGRIFGKDIFITEEWTYEKAAFSLPRHFYLKNQKPTHRNGLNWLDNLVWNPIKDSFPVALSKINEREGDDIESDSEDDY